MNLPAKIKTVIRRHELLETGDTVLVAVSGGPDSVALLSVVNALRYELGVRLHVAHVNHRSRRGADTDERFVRELTEKLQLPFSVKRLDRKRRSRKNSSEELLRDLRIRALTALAAEHRASKIALGHHRDDLAETVLMRMLRGSGLLGLQGIRPKKEIEGFCFIRPFLETSREDIRQYLKEERLPFREDPTNTKTEFFRNKIRLELLPHLEREYNPNVKETLAGLADTAAADYAFLEEQTAGLAQTTLQKGKRRGQLRIPLERIATAHPALQRSLIRLAVRSLQGHTKRLTLRHMKEIEDLIAHRPAGSVVHLPKDLDIRKQRKFLTLNMKPHG